MKNNVQVFNALPENEWQILNEQKNDFYALKSMIGVVLWKP